MYRAYIIIKRTAIGTNSCTFIKSLVVDDGRIYDPHILSRRLGDGTTITGFYFIITEVATFDYAIRFLRTTGGTAESGSGLMRFVVVYIAVFYMIKSAIDVDTGADSVSCTFAFAYIIIYIAILELDGSLCAINGSACISRTFGRV